MKRLIAAIIVLFAAGALLTTPIQRSRAYAQLQLAWLENWPLPRGRHLAMRAAPLLRAAGIAPPARLEIEPGVSLLLDPGDYIGREVLATGAFQASVWEWTAENLPSGGVMIDVGAHIGSIALRAAKHVGARGRVIAIEPNPSIAAQLRDNIRFSNAPNVTVEQVACGETTGLVELFQGPHDNSGVSSLSKQVVLDHASDGRTVYEVDLLPLDQIVAEAALDRIDLVKIDTEGAELRVLKGAFDTLAKFRPALILETRDRHLRGMGDSLEALEDWLAAAGYAKGRSDSLDAEWLPADHPKSNTSDPSK